MTRVKLSCKSCYGLFEISKSYFNGEDNPRFCPFCGKEQIINKGEYEVAKIEVDKKALVEKLLVDLIISAREVNNSAERQDCNRNHTNYGIASKCADILNFLDEDIDIACWQDGDYLKIPKVTINGKVTEYHNGK